MLTEICAGAVDPTPISARVIAEKTIDFMGVIGDLIS
jgi:hypothetical protein